MMILTDVQERLKTVAEELKWGIENKDWSHVTNALYELTGEAVEVDEQEEDLESMVAEFMSQRMSKKTKKRTIKKKTVKKKPKKKDNLDFTVDKEKQPTRTPVRATGENMFEDLIGDIESEVGKDKGYDGIDDDVDPSERSRKPFKKSRVECHKCNESFEIHPDLVVENNVCDSCASKVGK